MTFTYPSHTTKGCVPLSSDVSMTGYSSVLMVLMLVLVITALLSVFTITINERTSEFGVLASLGVSSPKLAGIVLTEGTIIGFLGGFFGICISVVALILFSTPIQVKLSIPQLNTEISYLLVLSAKCIFLSVAVSLLSSLYSTWKVSRTKLDGLIKGEEL
mgnify:CR=1 FL=1